MKHRKPVKRIPVLDTLLTLISPRLRAQRRSRYKAGLVIDLLKTAKYKKLEEEEEDKPLTN